MHSERGLRPRLVDGGARYARVLARVQLRRVGDIQRVVVRDAEAGLALKVDLLAVVEPDHLEFERVVRVGVAAESGGRAGGHFVVLGLVGDFRSLWESKDGVRLVMCSLVFFFIDRLALDRHLVFFL